MAIEIVDLPIKNGDFPVRYVNLPEVNQMFFRVPGVLLANHASASCRPLRLVGRVDRSQQMAMKPSKMAMVFGQQKWSKCVWYTNDGVQDHLV